MIIQFGATLTSENNSQNRGDSCSNIYPGFRTAKPRQRQKISYPNLSDLLNYTLNLKFVNIAFSLRVGATFCGKLVTNAAREKVRILSEFGGLNINWRWTHRD